MNASDFHDRLLVELLAGTDVLSRELMNVVAEKIPTYSSQGIKEEKSRPAQGALWQK